MVVLDVKLGITDTEILGSLPSLAPADLDAAWRYYQANPVEIEQCIWFLTAQEDGRAHQKIPDTARLVAAGNGRAKIGDQVRQAKVAQHEPDHRGQEAEYAGNEGDPAK